METTVITPLQCPNVLLIQEFVKRIAPYSNQALIREAVQKLPRYPIVSLNDINLLLQRWNCSTRMFKVSLASLQQLDFPLLSFLKGFENDQYFIIITAVSDEFVSYFSPYGGETVESFDQFTTKWSGALLRAVPHSLDSTHGIVEEDTESLLRKNYLQNHIRTYDHFLSDDTCDYIIQYCEEKNLFVRSEVEAHANESYVSADRTSYSAGIRERQNPHFKAILEKVSDLLNVPVNFIENLQCVKYSKGQQFKPHFDAGASNHRIHTMLVYLNDDFSGGETFFPELNLKVEPQKGRALYFLNRIDQSILLQSAHAGLPVANGTKYGCNIWVRNQPAVP